MRQRILLSCVAIAVCLIVVGLVAPARAIERLGVSRSGPVVTASPSTIAGDTSSRVTLGDTRTTIERALGPPTGLSGTMIAYAGGKLAIAYQQNRAAGVLVSFADNHPNLTAARSKVQVMLPGDRVLVGTMAAGAHRIADVYQSARLGTDSALATPTATPGQFVVVYEDDGTGAIRDALVVVGDVPTS
jgi:hypothetical protein